MANIPSNVRTTQNALANPNARMVKFASCGSIIRVASSTALLLFIALVGGAQELEVRVNHADAQYRAGETTTFSVSTSGADLAGVSNADFVIKKGGYTEIARGTVALPNGTDRKSTRLNSS